MGEMAARIQSLSPEQRRLLVHRLRSEGKAEVADQVLACESPSAAGRSQRPAGFENRAMAFSLSFFSADASNPDAHPYDLLKRCATFADANGLRAVWVPERHFHQFGGAYANPSILAAVVAAMTRQVRVRAGSVVVPLHDPIRVAEEWAMVDQLSDGRVDLAFASGWHVNDFALAPEAYVDRRARMLEQIQVVRRLWAGEPCERRNGAGQLVQVRTFPRPVQKAFGVWLTSSGSPETWVEAGKMGANVLTALLSQTTQQLADKISLYRRTLAEYGHDPRRAEVTLMTHVFVGETDDEAIAQVRTPFSDYLRTHLGLYDAKSAAAVGLDVKQFDERDRDALVAHAFNRYAGGSAMFGSLETCRAMVLKLAAMGITEISCLVDFGVPSEAIFRSLTRLIRLKQCVAEVVPQ